MDLASSDGRGIRITPYGDHIIRVQTIGPNEQHFPDDHYEIVASHQWPGQLQRQDAGQYIQLNSNAVLVRIDRESLAASFFQGSNNHSVLREAAPVQWRGNRISVQFSFDPEERFTGLGHGYFGRESSVDLRGKVVERNYGSRQIEQAPLLVPFYLSSKGYGVFLNSTFPNQFILGAEGRYGFSIDHHGFGARMDYFFIAGPALKDVLDRYTQLTGRPRLPAKSMFGLQLSDKAHDHTTATPSDERWWKNQVEKHRGAGLPLDHLVNDNRWRAGGGRRCQSRFAWDRERFPDPAAYGRWLESKGLVMTLDFNRCIAQFSDGWDSTFNLPATGKIDFENSAPDLTNAEFRDWFWGLMFRQALDPELGFPGDALWIDEFDEQGNAPLTMRLANGRSSAEMRNYWFFLIAKALVQQGWDRSGLVSRPYVWVRGMTAGAQRYATLWSGDIRPDLADMRAQVRAMQLAGLSGFPYWGHDAGGFFDWDRKTGPDDTLYASWAMAMGAFSPIWKPHGMGQSRWPLDRSPAAQQAAHRYGRLRYELMPYTYTAAHQAAATGLPMVRAMLLKYPSLPRAWRQDLQYFWGDSILVVPHIDTDTVPWLPPGSWYRYGSSEPLSGAQDVARDPGHISLFVQAGALIPRREFALSTAFIDKQLLKLDVYAGADGSYELTEDDDRSEAYRQGRLLTTRMSWDNRNMTLKLSGAEGEYDGSSDVRNVEFRFFGVPPVARALVNGVSEAVTYQDGVAALAITGVSVGDPVTVELLVE
ncbi:MAG: glycoside hydrolase family 31 protein [Xanthomonadales bacterium]|nr:glycoside hydrolase family 31 protein [Xanthomonadales bacterium]